MPTWNSRAGSSHFQSSSSANVSPCRASVPPGRRTSRIRAGPGVMASSAWLWPALASRNSSYWRTTSCEEPQAATLPFCSQIAWRAEGGDVVHGVRAEEQRAAAGGEFEEPVDALLLEVAVAHRERLVDDQDVGLDLRGDREAEAHRHAGRIGLHRLVDEFVELAEGDDLRRLGRGSRSRRARAGRRSARCSAARRAPGGRPIRARGSTRPCRAPRAFRSTAR